MPSYKTAFGSYLKSEDLQGKAVRVQIESVTIELIKDSDSDQKEKKLVAHFFGKDKAMILNRTNADALQGIFGTDDYDYWKGLVELFVDPNIRFGNKIVSGLRVRAASAMQAQAPPPPPPPPTFAPITDDDIPF
jgi:hypothetical protein